MSLQRIFVRVPFADPGPDPEDFVPVFHDWIRRRAVEGLLIDVTRYAHVHNGPGVILIGHEGDYSIDLAGGRRWLRYTLKRDEPGSPGELVARALRRLGGAVAEAQAAPGAGIASSQMSAGTPADRGKGSALFPSGELTIGIADRLRAPNTPATFGALAPEIAEAVQDVLGEAQLAAAAEADPRAPFTLSFVGADITACAGEAARSAT